MKYPYKLHKQISLTYEFPSTFLVGSKHTSGSLVNIAQLQGHLALMRAFAQLREKVAKIHEHPKAVLSRIPKDKNRRWVWFVGLAVERFTIWCQAIHLDDVDQKPIEDILPPIDVVMIWHAYMLNPGWYAEDGKRLPSLAALHKAGKVFAKSLPQFSSILASDTSDTRVEEWLLKTRRIFDPLDDAIEQEIKLIYCPTCRFAIHAPLMTNEGRGYLQHNFAISCPQSTCVSQPVITRGVLAARKMAEDLVRNDGTLRASLAGSLPLSRTGFGFERAKEVKSIVLSASDLNRPDDSTEEEWIVFILKKIAYSLKNLNWGTLRRHNGGWLVARILSAYVNDRMFSVELTGAVVRQGSFIKQINDIWWSHFSENQESIIALQHAIARYHAFLDLMTSSPTAFFVPTLDIDLVWHTHQLMASNYNEDCANFVGRFIDHDDKVNPNHLASSFDDTCRAWKTRFGIKYAHCGCLLPGESFKDKISHFLKSHVETPSHLVPIAREDILEATHASDHNAIFPDGEGPTRSAFKKYNSRSKRQHRLQKRGKADANLTHMFSGHNQAFLVPVSTYSQNGPVAIACATGGGSEVKPTMTKSTTSRPVGRSSKMATMTSGTGTGTHNSSGLGGGNFEVGVIGSAVDSYGNGDTGGGSSGGGGVSSCGGGCGGGGSSF